MAGLFGPRRPAFADIAIPVAPAQMPVAPQQQRRGLFGRLGQAVTPDRMMIAGAALRDLGTGRAGALDQTIASIRDAQLQQIEQQRLARQDEWQAEQQGRQRNVWSAQDRIAASAPPEQRDLVTADPSAFIAQRGARDQYQWQRQYDNENPEAITPYQQAQLGIARQQLSRSGASERAPPAGYRWAQNGSLEAIPGGPADLRATAAGQAQEGRLASSASSLENAIGVLNSAVGNVDDGSAGFWGQITRGVGGSDAYNLNQELEPVRAILSFENLAEMRRNSETGGALGSIAVRELDLLGSTVRSLDTAQSPDQLRRALVDTRAQLSRTLSAVNAARQEASGAQQQQAPQQPAQPRRIQLEPE